MRFLFLAALNITALIAGPLYTVQEVAIADASSAVLTSISSTGIMAGDARTINGDRFAYASTAGTGPMTLAIAATASDVSADGTVAGTSWTPDGSRATMWQNGATQMLDVMDSYATAINDGGAVVGSGSNGSRTSAFVYYDGSMTFVDAGRSSFAYDISNSGQMVGYAEMASGAFRAFSWTLAGGVRYLGTLGGRYSYAQAVNDGGTVVGSATNRAGFQHAFVWNGAMADLGTLGGTTSGAYDISAAGDVVGYATDSAGRSRAFLWRGGVLFDLNDLIDAGSGWTLEAAYGMNDRGEIVGSGWFEGRSTAFVLNPELRTTLARSAEPAAYATKAGSVPEPSTWTYAVLGIAVVAAARTMRPGDR